MIAMYNYVCNLIRRSVRYIYQSTINLRSVAYHLTGRYCCVVVISVAASSPLNMLICRPKITVAQQGFLPPIWASHLLRTTSRTKTSIISHHRKLHSNVKVAARYITSSRGTLRPSCGAQYIDRSLRQISTNFVPHNCTKSANRYFSGSLRTMTAEKIDGTAIARGIRARLQEEIKKTQQTNPRYKPSLTIIQGTCPLELPW